MCTNFGEFWKFCKFFSQLSKSNTYKICQNSWITKVHVKASALCLEKTRENKEWPKITDQIPETKWEKNNWWKIFFSKHYNRKTCMQWHEYGIVIKQVKTINYWHILAPLQICFPYSHKKYNFMSTESEGCNRIF